MAQVNKPSQKNPKLHLVQEVADVVQEKHALWQGSHRFAFEFSQYPTYLLLFLKFYISNNLFTGHSAIHEVPIK